ncbi:hypothetical protein LSH36_37g04015 [Paralvinella palmiformis]|uniref:Uncharacterized protein n=1 Tax=Paralvinella palmiformis TaxID=53620 RepID=A0AAD9K9Z3_9ANNE|nr:hypothetical protein LSH36_37g04015 [Paralvinella palmiformis]
MDTSTEDNSTPQNKEQTDNGLADVTSSWSLPYPIVMTGYARIVDLPPSKLTEPHSIRPNVIIIERYRRSLR